MDSSYLQCNLSPSLHISQARQILHQPPPASQSPHLPHTSEVGSSGHTYRRRGIVVASPPPAHHPLYCCSMHAPWAGLIKSQSQKIWLPLRCLPSACSTGSQPPSQTRGPRFKLQDAEDCSTPSSLRLMQEVNKHSSPSCIFSPVSSRAGLHCFRVQQAAPV